MAVLDADGVLTDDVIGADRGWAFLPTRPTLTPTDQVWPELRRADDGQLLLLTYTSLHELVAGCGQHQPWVLVPVDWLARIRSECRFDAVAVNAALPASARHQQEEERSWPGKPEEWDD
jgi:hypothetical protein